MVTMAQAWSPWRTGATRTLTWIARIHSRTYINTVTTMWYEAQAQLLQNLESIFFILKVPEGGGANKRKFLTACFTYQEKIQRPGRELNPDPPALVIGLPGQERASHLTH